MRKNLVLSKQSMGTLILQRDLRLLLYIPYSSYPILMDHPVYALMYILVLCGVSSGFEKRVFIEKGNP